VTVASQSVIANASETVEDLLIKAKKQIAKLQFTTPKGNNAYETYHILLKIAPQSAQPILDEIVAWYFKRGQYYIDTNRLTQPARGNAYKMYQKIYDIAPPHPMRQQLLSQLIEGFKQRIQYQLKRKRVTRPKNNNAYDSFQEIRAIMPENQEIQALSNIIVNPLIVQAEQQIKARKYTLPLNDNALESYQKILELSPNNLQAQEGLKKIADRYYQLALKKQSRSRRLTWVNRGLQAIPDHPGLNQLKQEIIN